MVNGKKIHRKKNLTSRQYHMFLDQKNPKTKKLKKIRQCFTYKQQYFAVDTFLNIQGNPSFLRIETTAEAMEVRIPPFIQVLREVSSEREYYTINMAKIDF